MRTIDIDTMLDAYREAALWSSIHYASDEWPGIEDGTPFDQIDADLSDDAQDILRQDCNEFAEMLEAFDLPEELTDEQIGHDLWLTRNGHGAGFWDRGLGELGDNLSDICRGLPERDLYLSDDGEIEIA